jgi:hypothetical protein
MFGGDEDASYLKGGGASGGINGWWRRLRSVWEDI